MFDVSALLLSKYFERHLDKKGLKQRGGEIPRGLLYIPSK